jgi:choline dehydrogenase-like flavoprotein
MQAVPTPPGASAADGDRRVIVIGSGPAGTAAALALTDAGIPTLMLESGLQMPSDMLVRLAGRNVFRRRQRRHVGEVAHVGDLGVKWHTALEPGGLSNQWTGAVPRFCPEDFYDGVRLNERYRWPLTYEELAPYYDKMEELLQVAGPTAPVLQLPTQRIARPSRLPRDWARVSDAAKEFGQGLSRIPLAGGSLWSIVPTATAYGTVQTLRRLVGRSTFDLQLGAHALRLTWQAERRLITGVEYHDRRTGATERVEASAVVLAAGPVATPKLLFDSACPDFPNGLGDTEGLLGRYLHDHVHDMFIFEVDKPLTRLGHPAYLTRASYGDSAPLLGASCTIGGRMSAMDRVLTFTPIPARRFGVIVFGSTVPSESNYARPHPELKDDFGFPRLLLQLGYTEEELRNTQTARERLIAIMHGAGIRSDVRWTLPQVTVGTSVHYGGTVRMHSDPKHGMTDSYCRLHNVPNLAVVDASCFTTAPEKNPTLTVMALASRAAERLAADLRAR